jgi:hypothetical protein
MSKPANVYEGVGYVETRTGHFYLERPEFVADDIMHSLSLLCRFNGHCKNFYSVAEHSVLVAELMDRVVGGDPWEGLWHDGTEAYLSDVPAPFKQFFPDWRKVEDRLDRQLRGVLGLPETKTPECKTADWLAVFIEAQDLLPTRGASWVDPEGVRAKAIALHRAGWGISGYAPETAKNNFRVAIDEYSKGRSVGKLG